MIVPDKPHNKRDSALIYSGNPLLPDLRAAPPAAVEGAHRAKRAERARARPGRDVTTRSCRQASRSGCQHQKETGSLNTGLYWACSVGKIFEVFVIFFVGPSL